MRNLGILALLVLLTIGIAYQVQKKKGNPLHETTVSSEPSLPPDSTSNPMNTKNQNTESNHQAPKVALRADPNCFSYEYHHKKEAQSLDIEDFLDFSNAFPIRHQNWNQKSLCVKVNQKPVAFKILKNHGVNEVIIGSVVGPDSVIRVSYCTGLAPCRESCATPKKRFLDEVALDSNSDDHFEAAWGESSDKEKKKELKAKVKELRTLASETSDLENRSIIRDWETLNQNEWICKEK